MKKKTNIRTVIRKIVREEVAMAIQEVIQEMKNPLENRKNKKTSKKAFSQNPVLNDILNETASEEYPTMGGGIYDSSRTNEVLSNQYERQNPNNPNGSLAAEMGLNPNDPAASFLKKDYRSIMKKVDKVNEKKGKM
tara:strand:+ start:1406 stop:1813 length:408 start_codon:yes stop_codon:yes gene_type:complete